MALVSPTLLPTAQFQSTLPTVCPLCPVPLCPSCCFCMCTKYSKYSTCQYSRLGINKPLSCRVVLAGSSPQEAGFLVHHWSVTLAEASADNDRSRLYLRQPPSTSTTSEALLDRSPAQGPLVQQCQTASGPVVDCSSCPHPRAPY